MARGFFTGLTGGFAMAVGAWLDVLIVVAIISLAYLKWDNFKYYMDIHGVYYTYGIFFKRAGFIPSQRISTFAVMKPFLAASFASEQSPGGHHRSAPPEGSYGIFVMIRRIACRIFSTHLLLPREKCCASTDLLLWGWCSFPSLPPTRLSESCLWPRCLPDGSDIGTAVQRFCVLYFRGAFQTAGSWYSAYRRRGRAYTRRRMADCFCFNLLQTKNLCTRRTQHGLQIGGGVITQKNITSCGSAISVL